MLRPTLQRAAEGLVIPSLEALDTRVRVQGTYPSGHVLDTRSRESVCHVCNRGVLILYYRGQAPSNDKAFYNGQNDKIVTHIDDGEAKVKSVVVTALVRRRGRCTACLNNARGHSIVPACVQSSCAA